MSTPYPQQPAGQPAAPAQPVQLAPQGSPQVVPQAGVPAQPAYQGVAPGYAPVPQGPVKVRVNYLSLVMGIGVWVFIALLVLDAWVEMHSPDASASGNDIFGFFPLFVLALGGPLNLIGVMVASSRAREKPAKWKLNRLAIILNASPYVIFFVIMFVGLAVAPFFS